MSTTGSTTIKRDIQSSALYNPDLAPVGPERRTWTTYNYAALWVSMSVNILTYMLAASLIQGGMNWKQAVLTVFLGNSIVLSAGCKRRRGAASAGCLRMVWNSKLDRRRSHQYASRDRLAGVAKESAWHRHLLHPLLGDQPRRDSQGHRVHPLPAGNQRAHPVGGRLVTIGVGLFRRRRLRPHALGAVAVPQHRRFSEIPHPRAQRDGRLLVNRLSQHSRLHKVCQRRTWTSHRTSHWTAAHHDALLVHRRGRDFGNGRDLRHGHLGSGPAPQPLPLSGRSRDFVIGHSAGDLEREYRRQRGLAGQ